MHYNKLSFNFQSSQSPWTLSNQDSLPKTHALVQHILFATLLNNYPSSDPLLVENALIAKPHLNQLRKIFIVVVLIVKSRRRKNQSPRKNIKKPQVFSSYNTLFK